MDVKIPCGCPGRPHDSDTVTLRDRLDFRQAASIKGDIVVFKLDTPDATAGETLAMLSEGYIVHGIAAWSFVDEKGKPLPVTRTNIRERVLEAPDLDTPMLLADAADDLYAEAVMRPLLGLASPSSPDTPTASSTSPEPSPSETASKSTSPISPLRQSKRSSTTTTPTDGTETTTASPDGDSKSSPSSVSAA